MIAWVLTYVLHSTALILLAWATARSPWGRSPRARAAIWKGALLGALVTATLQQATEGSATLAPPIRLAAPQAAGLPSPEDGGWPWAAVAWSAASGLAAARLLNGWLRLRRMTGRRRVLARGSLRRELDAMLTHAGVTRRVTLSCSRGLAVPRAIGAREICVPLRALRDLTPPEQRALLAHETAHLLRRDGAWLFVAAVVQTVVWWQPLTRLAVARLQQAMELCCDDWAAARLPDRLALADCLVKVGEWGVAAPAGLPLAAFTSRGSTLRERVERLMDDDRSGRAAARTPWLAAIPVLVVFGFAPGVMPAETSMIPTLVVPALLRPDAGASMTKEPQPVPQAPVRTGRAAKSRPSASPPPPVSSDPMPASSPAAADAGEPAQSAPAPDSPAVITMPEPLVTPSSRLRITSRAVRALPAVPARSQPDFTSGKDGLERRIGLWLDWYERNPTTIDPLRPKYLLPEGRSYLTHIR